MSAIQEHFAELQARVIRQAQEDPAFRADLLRDPKAALERAWGLSLPPELSFNVVESAPNTLAIALPPQARVAANGELSDDELESVAGGSKSGFNLAMSIKTCSSSATFPGGTPCGP